MIIVNERVETTVPAELLDRLRGIPPATIGHILDFGFMDIGLRPIGKRKFTICGPAFTVKAMAIDSTVVHKAIDMAQPGDILVIDRNGDNKHACWGEMTSLGALMKGVTATIVDGPATDVVEIEEMEYLVFSRGISPITTRSLAMAGEINTVVQCGGVSVTPGDIILADDNGVLVLKPDQVAALVEHCEPIAQREPTTRKRLRSGEPLAEISNANKKIAAALEAQAAH
ncbi:MAG TPA: RraA family protein [Thermomicrobiales bacterium]|nr:RraA family protein [Thermomicrobiales bacterium]